MATATKSPRSKQKKPVDRIHEHALENAKRQQEAADRGEEAKPRKTTGDYDPVLTLSTDKPVRASVDVDGERYEIISNSEFSILEQHELQEQADRFDELQRKRKLIKREKDELVQLLDALFQRVFEAPDEIKAKMNDAQKQAIIVTFTRAPLLLSAQDEMLATMYEEETEEETEEDSL